MFLNVEPYGLCAGIVLLPGERNTACARPCVHIGAVAARIIAGGDGKTAVLYLKDRLELTPCVNPAAGDVYRYMCNITAVISRVAVACL